MKPGSKDKKFYIKIEGEELEELQKYTYEMAESFGLDRRIDNYKGKRPIGLYRWDLECLRAVLWFALFKDNEYPDKTTPEYKAMNSLFEKINRLYNEAFDDCSETEEK